MENKDILHYQSADFAEMETFYRRNLINTLSGFKSVNLVGTQNQQGQTNLAIFSQIFHVGATPPLMGMIVRPDKVARHTLENIRATGYYTFNHIKVDFYQKAHQTSARYEVSEFEACGLSESYGKVHPAPYVAESPLKIGLKLEEEQRLAINGTILVIGRVVELQLPKASVQVDGFIDLEAIGSITCSGLDSYHTTERLARLSYAKANLPLKVVSLGEK